ncbi:surfeit locus protein 5 subunit 22 of mediator complex-domain-containing protein [Cristinia sonorae]|uniref:Surfeit locus protein 5 subunit 22 of mediator complex-domain-containing protein n=1 Tax=Cristinia sonorae TaxID=1940300 RepID=A0A8K0XPZ7_9AGAR|nr:surfeit locus protein 5 subunit 22 of mediator complex-domain-containing protein [Cristinia sonorae]
MSEVPQTDVVRRVALPTASLLSRSSQPTIEQDSSAYLDAIEEEWNKKVDVEVETLVDGMVDLVGLASIENKDKFRVALEAFQAQCRAESMIRAANSLVSIIHSMKLLLLLSDESQIANRRDAEQRGVQAEKEETKKKVAALLDELLDTRREHVTPPNPDVSMETA